MSDIPVKFVVCAQTTVEAESWARLHGIPPRQRTVVGARTAPAGLLGMVGPFAVVRLPSWFRVAAGVRDAVEVRLTDSAARPHGAGQVWGVAG